MLENTFSRMTEAAAHRFPWLPVRMVMRNRYDSLKRIKNYSRAAVPMPRDQSTRYCRLNWAAHYLKRLRPSSSTSTKSGLRP